MTSTDSDIRFTVFCHNCGNDWQPKPQSPLWWQAKKRAEKYLDALCVSGEKCGCVSKKHKPNAPYRVFGDYCGEYFNRGFDKFTDAVNFYRSRAENLANYVYITGVSERVAERLEYGI